MLLSLTPDDVKEPANTNWNQHTTYTLVTIYIYIIMYIYILCIYNYIYIINCMILNVNYAILYDIKYMRYGII